MLVSKPSVRAPIRSSLHDEHRVHAVQAVEHAVRVQVTHTWDTASLVREAVVLTLRVPLANGLRGVRVVGALTVSAVSLMSLLAGCHNLENLVPSGHLLHHLVLENSSHADCLAILLRVLKDDAGNLRRTGEVGEHFLLAVAENAVHGENEHRNLAAPSVVAELVVDLHATKVNILRQVSQRHIVVSRCTVPVLRGFHDPIRFCEV